MSNDTEAVKPKSVPAGSLVASPEVVAAISAAVEVLWPKRRPPARPTGSDRGTPEYVWRFSGRWWSKPVPIRRDRPWAVSGLEHGQIGTEGA